MPLGPAPFEILNRARADLRMGLPVVLSAEGGLALVIAAETLNAARLDGVRALPGALSLVVTARRAETLKVTPYDGDLARIEVPEGRDLAWVRALGDPSGDLSTPLKGPLRALRGGPVALHRAAVALAKSARLLPAMLVLWRAVAPGLPDGAALAADLGLTHLDIDRVPLLGPSVPLHEVIGARLPMMAAETGRLHVFRPEDGGEEHYAIEIGDPAGGWPDRARPVLARLHSACFTGDLLGSLKCDCGPQLRGALAMMGAEGGGVLLYLNQEGRGIGLANKMRAYALQDEGFDTVEANHRLGFEDDERDFRIGAAILTALGFSAVRLLTNNPAKVRMMEAAGIAVTERVPLRVGETAQNRAYLATKVQKSGHFL